MGLPYNLCRNKWGGGWSRSRSAGKPSPGDQWAGSAQGPVREAGLASLGLW